MENKQIRHQVFHKVILSCNCLVEKVPVDVQPGQDFHGVFQRSPFQLHSSAQLRLTLVCIQYN
jgi:hypothetical protein